MPRALRFLSAPNWASWLVGVFFIVISQAPVRAAEPPPFAFGVYLPTIREVPRKDIEVSMRFWFEELARMSVIKIRPVRYYDDMASLKRDVNAGDIDFFIASAMGVAEVFPPGELRDGVVSYKTVDDDLLLIVRRDAGIRSIKDMAGKRFAMLDADELSKVYLETLLLSVWGPTGADRLTAISLEPRSSKLTHRLFFGQADAALVYRSGYEAALELNPQIGQRLQVLDAYTFKTRSPFIGLFGAHVDDSFRELLIKIMLTVGETPRGRQVLQLYQGNVMARASVSEIAPYKALLDKRRLLRQSGSGLKEKP